MLTRNEIKREFIVRSTDGKKSFCFRIEAEKLKRQLDENMKSYIHGIKSLVDKVWPRPPDADANAQTAFGNHRIGTYKDFLLRELTPQDLHKMLTRQ